MTVNICQTEKSQQNTKCVGLDLRIEEPLP